MVVKIRFRNYMGHWCEHGGESQSALSQPEVEFRAQTPCYTIVGVSESEFTRL